MYNILHEDNRYISDCVLSNGNIQETSVLKLVIDTGARFTCIKAQALWRLFKEVTEQQLIVNKCPFITIGGFVNGDIDAFKFRVYKYTVKQFTVGNIDLGTQTIGVYFDNRVSDNVIGMDILSKLNYTQFANQPFLYLFDDLYDMKYYNHVNTINRKKCVDGNKFYISVNNSELKFPLSYIKYNDPQHPNGYIDIGMVRCYL